MPGPKYIPPEALAKAQRLYEETDLPLADIAALLDVNETTVYRRARRLGWKSRRKPWESARPNEVLRAHGAPPLADEDDAAGAEDTADVADAETPDEFSSAAMPDMEQLAARVEAAAKAQLVKVERLLRMDASAEVETQRGERAARTLASLARSLATLRRALKLNSTTEIAEDVVSSDADIRREIARTLERLAAGDVREADGEPEPPGA